MSRADKIHKIWKILEKILFPVFTVIMLFLMYLLLYFMELERFNLAQAVGTEKIAESSVFWLLLHLTVPQIMLTVACLIRLIRMLGNITEVKPLLPAKLRKILLIIAVVILMSLPVFCFRYGIIYHASYDADNEQAIYDANKYYPYVIYMELAIGFIIWLLVDRHREIRCKRRA